LTVLARILCGPHSNFFVIDTEETGVCDRHTFQARWGFPFFKLPVDELHNQHVGLDDLWGTEAGLLRERLLEAATPEDKFKVLEDCLTSRPSSRFIGIQRWVLRYPVRQHGSGAHDCEVTDQIGLSPRHFIQLFSARSGLRPSCFAGSAASSRSLN